MKVKTHLKSGKLSLNHNETLVRDRAKGLKVKTRLKSGGAYQITTRPWCVTPPTSSL